MKHISRRDISGFTLVELMMTLVILAILLGVGVPSFNLVLQNVRSASLANDLTSGLNLARSEAITRSAQVDICPSNNGTSCSGSWTDGWIVIVNATSEVLRRFPEPPAGATITQTPTANATISFGPLGQPVAGLTQLVAQVDGCSGDRAREINLEPAGRVRTRRVACV